MSSIEQFAQAMEQLCNDDSHGYSQINRWGPDYDCGSAIIHALQMAGFDTGAASYTGNMSAELTARGWVRLPASTAKQRGDVLLNDVNHVALYLGNNQLAEFSISENGTIDGQSGDQTGREAYIHSYYDYPWDCVLRYTGTGGSTGETDSGGIDIYYSVMLADGTVLPEIKNLEPDSSGDDFAGIAGREIYGIAIRVSAGSIKYRVQTVDGVLHEFVTGCDFADYWNGYAGDGEHAIATLEAYLYSPNGDRYVYYRLSPVGQDYYPYQRDMDKNQLMDGWAGEPGVAVDRLQMYIGE